MNHLDTTCHTEPYVLVTATQTQYEAIEGRIIVVVVTTSTQWICSEKNR